MNIHDRVSRFFVETFHGMTVGVFEEISKSVYVQWV